MKEEDLKKLENYLKRLEGFDLKRLENLNVYLERNGEIVIDLMMRVAALETLLKESGTFSEEEVQKAVSDSYALLDKKAKEMQNTQGEPDGY